jgi:hypothetical protein
MAERQELMKIEPGAAAVPYLAADDPVSEDVRDVRRQATSDLASMVAQLLRLEYAVALERVSNFVHRIRLEPGAPDGLPALAALNRYGLAAILAESHEEMIAVMRTSGMLDAPAA